MDWHHYITGQIVEEQLAERRAVAARERLLQTHRAPRPPLRVAVGTVLIRLGSWIVGAEAATRLNTRHRRA